MGLFPNYHKYSLNIPKGTICKDYDSCEDFEGTIEETTDILGYEAKKGYCEKYDTCKKEIRK